MCDKNPEPNLDEVMDFTWKDIEEIKNDIKINGEKYTSWFKIILENEEFLEKINLHVSFKGAYELFFCTRIRL